MNPNVTVRLSNPVTIDNKYTVDVMFKSDTPLVLRGGNFRFWFDYNSFITLVKFTNFQGGYGPTGLTPLTGVMGAIRIPKTLINYFSFDGDACWVNGAFQLNDINKPISLSNNFTKLFSLEFNKASTNKNQSIVLDLEVNPANGGFLPGNDGIVLASTNVPGYIDEHVEQFNWVYNSSLVQPFGHPINN